MEKSGRWLKASRCRRLLTAGFCFFAASAALFADNVNVDIFVSTFELETSHTLHVEFTVLDVDPADVSVEETGIPSSFSLVSGQKERRMKDNHSATVVSRDWVPSIPGNFSLGPFSVTAHGSSVTLPQIYITVTQARNPVHASIFWTVSDGQVATGRPLRITLEGVFSGAVQSLACPAPENAILEPVPSADIGGKSFAGTEETPVQLGSWMWTPLVPGVQGIPRAQITYTGSDGVAHVLSSAPLEISVAREAAVGERKSVSGSVSRAFSGSAAGPSDGTASKSTAKSSATSGNKLANGAAASAVIPHSTSETLAALRNAEYTSLFPRSARLKRLAIEDDRDLGTTLAVPPAAWKPFFVIGAVLAFSLAFLLRLTGAFSRPLRPVSFALFFLSILLVILAVTVYTRDPGPAGVLRGCDLLHVPEAGSSVVDSLPEGTAVVIGRRVGSWVYIRTVTDLDGWVPAAAIIEYTSERLR